MKVTCIEHGQQGLATLAVIEYRIASHMQGAYENIIEVGRCLCEAKDAGLVPHGQWEAWVRKNTGMSERSAQKLMQTARSVSSGSSLARLPISKITTILSLPEPEREPMAERAVTEDMSLRELQEAVKREKQRADQLAAEKAKSIARATAAERELGNLKADIPKLAENLAEEYVKRRKDPEKWFSFFHFVLHLNDGPCYKKRLVGCGAGSEYLAVAPNGDVYPCHQFVGQTKFKLGNVFDGKLNDELRHTFARTSLFTKDECQNCWAKYHCSGGCNANSVNFNGDMNKPYKPACEMMKKRLECSMYVFAKENN